MGGVRLAKRGPWEDISGDAGVEGSGWSSFCHAGLPGRKHGRQNKRKAEICGSVCRGILNSRLLKKFLHSFMKLWNGMEWLGEDRNGGFGCADVASEVPADLRELLFTRDRKPVQQLHCLQCECVHLENGTHKLMDQPPHGRYSAPSHLL